ncbi:WGxxGxxG family protein [Tianweitania sediminis]|jgi:MYXO-CTERM domain-containing protein|uniref:WGxxGxxG-CTERM domain-containing protein n=1 Tax=Tianweitania sediminis TaxID=1502156 RepID=A0A8J7R3N2_9HYPH|nr:WGxxGxxG family protein [Tianweitania sediminis]MBP0441182.1 WGxxGxxG-CTERM domain-containing protein [Tianweitania sediminis]
MQKLLLVLGTTCLITFAAPALVQSQTTPVETTPAETTTTAVQADDDDGFDLGWLGLLGLIGLAGLRGRRDDRHHVGTTTR